MTHAAIDDYARIERAIRFLDAHRAAQPSLADAAPMGVRAGHALRDKLPPDVLP